MTEDLDQILLSDEDITPSDGFTASVMEAVRRDLTRESPIRFPWGRFAAGLIGSFLCTALSVAVLSSVLPPTPEPRVQTPQGSGVAMFLYMLIALTASLLAVRFSFEATSD